MSIGARLIQEERHRQVAQEGWSESHDDGHMDGELLAAATAYIQYELYTDVAASEFPPNLWPWERESWKPSDETYRNLVKAGALIAAEIDRHLRMDGRERERRADQRVYEAAVKAGMVEPVDALPKENP